MRLKLTLAYDGAEYEGWQIQLSPRRPPTVQGAVEAALFQLLGRECRVFGAGRTDSGVHALGQVCHVDVPEKGWDWRKRLNAVLPPDIRIVEAREAPCDFHARKDAVGKIYFYNFWTNPDFMPPSLRCYAWNCGALDDEAMRQASAAFVGEHDFASLQNAGTDIQNTKREITALELEWINQDLCPAGPLALLRLTVAGNGFLKQMVRNMAGCLAAVGKGRIEPRSIGSILEARSRGAIAAATAPARGLFLAKVMYRQDL